MIPETTPDDLELTPYQVALPDFEGPLDLLLSLIEKEHLDITRISLARVTDQFLAYVTFLQQVNPDELTDFLVVAAKLILIKSEVLLPRPPASVLDEDEEDVGDDLAQQLILYKKFKEIAQLLQENEANAQRSYIRVNPPPPKIEPKLVPGGNTVDQLIEAAIKAFTVKPPDPDVDEIVSRRSVTIGQQMAKIREQLSRQAETQFNRLLSNAPDRVEVVVTLLAVLELIKRRVVLVEQDAEFGDVRIIPNTTAPELSADEWAGLAGQMDLS